MPVAARITTMTAEVAQLTRPIHVAIQQRVVTHPALLDQLREACAPGGSVGDGASVRRAPGSRPPLRVATVDLLAEIYVGISTWHARLNLASPPRNHDWQKATLRALVDATPDLAPAIADWLAIEIHDWWRMAATGSGWRPEHLRKLQ